MTDKIITPFVEIPANKRSVWMRKLIHGIGVNDAPYMTQPKINGKTAFCTFYTIWRSMIQRCYSEKCLVKHPAYIGCTVIEEWHSFMKFRRWMKSQDWKGKELDKDILIIGNKIYSPETCIFVSSQINTLLIYNQENKGGYPAGVSLSDRGKKKFQAECQINGKKKYLGRFETIEEASEVYKAAKSNEIKRVALLQSDIRIREGLLRHAEHLLNG